MHIVPVRTRIFKEREALAAFVKAHASRIPERSVVAIASKIVALSEGRTAPRDRKRHMVATESERAVKTRLAWLTVKDGMMMANAGVDESNADGKLVLLPSDGFAAARRLRSELMNLYGVKRLGVVIADSHVAPLRAGVTAHAVGYAGIKGVRDYRGKRDLFGRTMRISRVNVADSLATAAALVMGEGAERQPIALITDAPVEFVETVDRKEAQIASEDDLYRPLVSGMRWKRKPVAPRGTGAAR